MRRIRQATSKDTTVLTALSTATFLETFGHLYAPNDLEAFLKEAYDSEIIRRELEDPRLIHLLIEEEDTPLGFARYGPCKLPIEKTPSPTVELHRFYISKSYHGQGLGTMLIERVMDDIGASGAKSVFLGVWEGNAQAQKFYASHGFKQVGEYLFYVGSHADRELILRKLL
jgi:ribosomal protein S18 acetylase RimI-like enzyme